MTGMWIAIAVGFGLVIGSFLTVVVDRVPRGASIVQPGSACGSCGARLGVLDLIPVVSWVVLRGRCRRCGERIGVEPLIVEVTTAAAFALVTWLFGARVETIGYCVLMAGLVSLSWIDLHTKRLPREISYTTAAIGLPVLALAAALDDEWRRIPAMAIGAGISFGLMFVIYLGSRGGLGDGDVRLSPVLGAFLGWLNPGLAAVGLFFGFAVGAMVSVVLLILRRAGRRTAVPFGPFLALGTVLALLSGQEYIDAVLGR